MKRKKNISWIVTCLSMVVGWSGLINDAMAIPPRKPSASQFKNLVMRSPFTIRPTSKNFVPISRLEQEWMLGSIRPSGHTWRVTLINKKDRNERVRLIPGFAADGFELLDVKQDLEEPMKSEVEIRKGGQTATIRYDEKLIKVKATGANKAAPVKPVSPGRRIAVPSSAQNSASRARRVVLPKK